MIFFHILILIMTNQLGQFFTKNIVLKEKLYDFIFNNPTHILEPSIGQGDLVSFVLQKNKNIIFDMYEIDSNIELLNNIEKNKIIYGDFLTQSIEKTYITIIGNPPYIRTKTGNLYIDFTQKCYDLLDNNGELIFIVPSDFFKLTSASKLLNIMMKNGTFTHIFHPHNEKMFDNASIDVIIFRYCKNNLLEKKVIYNEKLLYITNSNGLIVFQEKINDSNVKFNDIFDIYVGFVSGKESVYKNNILGNIEILNSENKIDKYIYIENFPSTDEKINEYLLDHKKELLQRRMKKFNENNWFEWGALRNKKTIVSNLDKDCIYISLLTRKKNVSFLGKIGYFGGGLIMLKPKKEDLNLNKTISYLNSDLFKNNFIFSGRFKIGHRQLCNSFIPLEFLDSSYI